MLKFAQDITVDLNVELTNNVLNSIHVNQYEHKSREINIYVKKDGTDYAIPNDLTVNIRIHKSNGYDIYKTIGKDIGAINGNIITILVDESMTIAPGRQTCDIEFIDSNNNRLYSTKFYINVHKSALDDNNIKDNDDYSTVQSLARESKEYANLSKSYAVGTEDKVRENDSTDNAKYYKEQSEMNANNALEASKNAKSSANEATTSADNASRDAQQSASSARQASGSAMTASDKASQATDSAAKAESFAHGGTGTRENEDIDNAKHYYEQIKSISESFSGTLRPMGTINFSQFVDIVMSTASEGDMYNILDEFTTNVNFKEGSGLTIPAGSNIYKTADGMWDVLAGNPVTSVNGMRGNVNITPASIKALPDTIKYAGSDSVGGAANTAMQVNGTYTGNGGQQSPSYVTSGKTRFNMWNAFKGITNPAGGYMDVILMDNYTGSDVPYVTGIGVTKNNGNPRMFIANGTKGGTGNWAHQVEVITTANISSQTIGSATKATQDGSGNVITSTYFPKTGGTLTGGASDNTGYISARSKSGNWTNGMTLSNAAFSVSNGVTDTGYYPVLAAKTKSGNFWNIGTFQDNVGLYGFKAGRTTNGTDWSISVDTNNGDLTTTGKINMRGNGVELYYSTPYIDFHFNNSSTDYTSRIIESRSGTLECWCNNLVVNGKITVNNNWIATTGASGWINDTYGGGIYMTDSTWVRTYNNKSIYTGSGTIRSDYRFESYGGQLLIYDAAGNTRVNLFCNDGQGAGLYLYSNYSNNFPYLTIYSRNSGMGYINITTPQGTIYSPMMGYGSRVDTYTISSNSSGYYLHCNTNYGAYGITMWASDTKLKKNISPTKIDNVLEKIEQIEFVGYDWKDENLGHVDLGISANQLEPIIPEAVYEVDQTAAEELENNDNNYGTLKNINGNIINVYCLKAIQELTTKVKDLEAKLSKYEPVK